MSMAVQAVPRTDPADIASPDPRADAGLAGLVARHGRRLQARLRSTWRPLTVVLMAPPHVPGDASAIDASLDAFDAWADAHEGVHVDVQLSGCWLLCCATPEAATAPQARELALQQWSHYFGLSAEQVAAEWQVAEVLHGDVKLVCAVPRALIEGLQEVAREHGLSLQSAMPWWAESLQTAWEACLREAPATTQPEGATRQWAWAEPGLLNQAQARVRDGRWVLERVWSEVRLDAATSLEAGALPAPTLLATLSPPADAPDARVWTHVRVPATEEGA